MSKLSKADVLHVARLAKLNLKGPEVDRYLKQLSKVVDYVSVLQEIDTSSVAPTSQTTGLENVYRSDEINSQNILSKESALAASVNVENDYFKAAAVLPKKGSKK